MISYLKPSKELRRGFKDPKRMTDIHRLPCALCYKKGWTQRTRTTVHHLHGVGAGKKVSDKLSMALCDEHHQNGEFAFHKLNRVGFEEKFGVTQEDLIELTNRMLSHEL